MLSFSASSQNLSMPRTALRATDKLFQSTDDGKSNKCFETRFSVISNRLVSAFNRSTFLRTTARFAPNVAFLISVLTASASLSSVFSNLWSPIFSATLANVGLGSILPTRDRLDVIGPALQCLTHLAFVLCSIIDARHASTMTANVVEHGFDDVRQHAKPIRHHCCGGATKIMQPPVGEGHSLIESVLRTRPARIATLTVATRIAEEKVAILAGRGGGNKRQRCIGQGNDVLAMIFRPRCGDRPKLFVLIDFCPAHAADLVTALARQHEQLDDPSVVVISARTPDFGQLGIRQDPLPRLSIFRVDGIGGFLAVLDL